ncbi:MAG: hypothetical protein LBF13_02550 [Campylobacteraceae bacterium]|jgi:hypothetical protein|nr:hypothetical protein [Campylobacteraceae bacterium]
MKSKFKAFAALFVLSVVCTSTHAFIPGYPLAIVPGEYHEKMVAEALDKIYEEYGYGSNGIVYTNTMKTAVKTIAKANSQVDYDNRSGKAIWHCDGEQLTGCSNNVKEETVKGIGEILSDKTDNARNTIGGATHTLQDFYAHSNWAELYGSAASDEMGYGHISNVAEPDEDTCEYEYIHPLTPPITACSLMNSNNIITTKLTSGYFKGTSVIPDGVKKCFHGGFLDGFGVEGINKDASVCSFTVLGIGVVISPHSNLHKTAASAAKLATVKYFRNIRNALTAKEGEFDGDNAFRKFLGFGGTAVGFIINAAEEMEEIKAIVAQMVQSRIGTDEEPSLYVLSAVNNSSIPEHLVFTHSNVFLDALSNLHAEHSEEIGADCPELSGLSIYKAVLSLMPGSTLFIYANALVKNKEEAKAASMLANKKNIKINSILSGQCSRNDLNYFEISDITGGQVFVIDKSEAEKLAELSNILINNYYVELANIYDKSTSKNIKSYEFKVDSKTDKISITVSIIDGNATAFVIRPDGSIVKTNEFNVQHTLLSSVMVYDIKNPDIGTWKVDIEGNSEFIINVAGNSPLSFDNFKFVEYSGRTEYGSLFEIDSFPVAGTVSAAEATVSDTISDVRFELKSRNGDLLETLTFNAADQYLNTKTIFLKEDFVIPNEDFVVYAIGKDENGIEFQRALPQTIAPQTMGIMIPAHQDIPLDINTIYTFRVTNYAENGTFNFTAIDDKGYIVEIKPAAAIIDKDGYADINVTLNPGNNKTTIGDKNILTFLAYDTNNTKSQNYAIVESIVVNNIFSQNSTATTETVTDKNSDIYKLWLNKEIEGQ